MAAPMMVGLLLIAFVLVLIGSTVVSAVSQGACRDAQQLDGFPTSHVRVIPLPYDQAKESA